MSKKIRKTIKQIAETPLEEAYPGTYDFFHPYGNMKKVCEKCGRYQKICICINSLQQEKGGTK